jgi:glycine/serine hydroxymethyltransferase
MREAEMETVGSFIDRVVNKIGNETISAQVRGDVHQLCSGFPIYQTLVEKN